MSDDSRGEILVEVDPTMMKQGIEGMPFDKVI